MFTIVIDSRMIRSSGIGTYLQNIIHCLQNDYKVILTGDKRELEGFSWSKELQIVDFRKPIYSFSEQFSLPWNIPKSDLLISPHYNIPIFPIKARKRIVIIHDVYHLAFYDELNLKQKLYAKFMLNVAAKISNHIITVSNFSKSEILKFTNANPSKITIVYFGLDTNVHLTKLQNSTEAIRKKYNIPPKFFLFVGNIKPHKNLYNLMLAYKSILIETSNYKLVVVGEYEKLITVDKGIFKLIESNAELKNNIIFTGYVEKDELEYIYKMSEALIFPSFYEGFGIPPIEAMLFNCPVIASNAPPITEACGDAALYFNPDDSNDIAKKILTFIYDAKLREKLVEKGKVNINRFSIDSFSKNLKYVINLLLQ